ncbi:MAG: bacterial transcriptional activator domain-containing protein, partial [Anaerolineae bacterium]|nr:bacterial transcriptional activator domain-containing protein [Anaerolineae bacterium]
MATNPSTLTIRLLGSFALERLPSPPPTLRRKTRALLAYLAAADQPPSRQHLADLFCQEANAPSRVLSLLFSRIRNQLGADFLQTENNTVRLNPQLVRVDYATFRQQLSGDLSRQDTASIESAVSLYRGEFLEAFSLPDAPEFEQWLLGQRAQVQQLLERALASLVRQFSRSGSYEPAIQYARRLLQHNPLLEDAHAQLIWLYAQTGQREAALRQYDHCQTLLQAELGVSPTDTLQQLRTEIQAGALSRPALQTELAAIPTTAPIAPDFVGRAA